MGKVCSKVHWAAACLLFGFAIQGWSQSDLSTITGAVKDPSGGAVPTAKVSVTNEKTGVNRNTTTNDAGVYTVSNIPAGSYTVTVVANGFKKFTSTGNQVDANVPRGVDVTLEVGQLTESVNVTADASALQTESATLGLTVDERQVRDLMLNGRNPVLLAALKPGVRSSASLANFNFNLTDGGFSMNGSRPNDNVFFYDGAVATRTRSNGTSIGAADVDSTEEVQVLTSNYAAEYGRSGGGQVRVVTKSGSRDFHGTAYEFFRNSAMDANTWARNNSPLDLLNSGPQPLRYNQFGYNVSGPVVIGKFNRDRNKFFFLFGQEWVRYRTSPANTGTVPSLKMRTGDFSELLTAPNPFFSKTYQVTDANGVVSKTAMAGRTRRNCATSATSVSSTPKPSTTPRSRNELTCAAACPPTSMRPPRGGAMPSSARRTSAAIDPRSRPSVSLVTSTTGRSASRRSSTGTATSSKCTSAPSGTVGESVPAAPGTTMGIASTRSGSKRSASG